MKEFLQDSNAWILSAGLVMAWLIIIQLIFTKEK